MNTTSIPTRKGTSFNVIHTLALQWFEFIPLILLFGTFCTSSKRLALENLFSLGLLGGVGTYDPVIWKIKKI